MPEDIIGSGIQIDFGITGIIVIAYAAIILLIAVIALVLLFRQKSLLAQINNTLMRQGMGAPAAQSYAPPVPNICPKCGTPFTPGAAFCQKCGSALQ